MIVLIDRTEIPTQSSKDPKFDSISLVSGSNNKDFHISTFLLMPIFDIGSYKETIFGNRQKQGVASTNIPGYSFK